MSSSGGSSTLGSGSTNDHNHSQKSHLFNSSLAREHRGSVTDIIRSLEVEEEKEKHVLVVDDDNISRNVLSKMLEKLNFKVTTVEGGKQALALLSQDSSVSLLLVDVLMPEMDGLELLKIFKKAYSQDIPTIMVSSSEDPDTIAQCFQSGAEDFLQKPIRFEMLKRRVEMCLDDRLRRRKETMYQEMLRKERENRNRLSKQVEEQEKELEQIKSQISDTIETPMQVVMKTIGDLMEGTYSVEQYKGALVAILKSLGSRDLYRPAFSMLLEKGKIDDTTRKWLQSEFMSEDETAVPHKAQSRLLTVPPIQYPSATSGKATVESTTRTDGSSTNASTTSEPTTPKKGVHFNESQNSAKIIENTVQPTMLRNTIPNLNSFTFDVFAYSSEELIENAAYMYQSLGLVDEFNIDPAKIMNFLRKLQQFYQHNPYHNLTHALDVTQFVYSCLCVDRISSFLSPIEKLCLMVAAMCHDVDHPGLNNNYQVNAKTALALMYNDISVLENHHCCIAFRLLRDKDCNLVENLDSEQYKEFRKTTITTILATDMAHHFEILTKFQTRIQTGPLSKESKDDKQQFMNMILKCADVSNATRPFAVAKKWANMLIEEFLYQGDKEREQGLAISPLMDRTTLDKAQMQVNFIDYIAGPLFKCFVQYVSNLQHLTTSIQTNRVYWSARLEKQQEGASASPNSPVEDSAIADTFASNESTSSQEVTNESATANMGIIPIDQEVEILDGVLNVRARVKGFSVLLVEVNSSDVSDLLGKCGFDIKSEDNVQRAMDTLKLGETQYDVVVIDFSTKSHGIEALQFAREVRQFETSNSSTHYTGIVGLVHPALTEDMDKTAPQAGVDVILRKPVPAKDFLMGVEKAVEVSLNYADSVDMKLALEQSGGDEEFLKELLADLVADGKKKAADFPRYISELDWDNLNLNAHSLKGASAQLACKPLAQASFVLERAAKTKEQENLVPYLKTLQKRVNELEDFVNNKLN